MQLFQLNHSSSSYKVHALVNIIFLMTRFLSDFEGMAISPRTVTRMAYSV